MGLRPLQETHMSIRIISALGLAASLLAAPAVAHHSFAMFDQNTMTHIKGTVTEFEWINPHVWLHIEVTTEAGEKQTWSFEGGSIGQLSQTFWTQESVVVGEEIDVGFHPLKDGSYGGQLIDVTKPDGKFFCQGGDCRDRLREEGLLPSG
jgi:hypothetical protein